MTRTRRYVIDPADPDRPIPCEELLTWACWLETNDADRAVAYDTHGDVRVSTVFLALDHNFHGVGPPVLWETLVIGGKLDGERQRYTSRSDALRGHAALLARVIAAGV